MLDLAKRAFLNQWKPLVLKRTRISMSMLLSAVVGNGFGAFPLNLERPISKHIYSIAMEGGLRSASPGLDVGQVTKTHTCVFLLVVNLVNCGEFESVLLLCHEHVRRRYRLIILSFGRSVWPNLPFRRVSRLFSWLSCWSWWGRCTPVISCMGISTPAPCSWGTGTLAGVSALLVLTRRFLGRSRVRFSLQDGLRGAGERTEGSRFLPRSGPWPAAWGDLRPGAPWSPGFPQTGRVVICLQSLPGTRVSLTVPIMPCMRDFSYFNLFMFQSS